MRDGDICKGLAYDEFEVQMMNSFKASRNFPTQTRKPSMRLNGRA